MPLTDTAGLAVALGLHEETIRRHVRAGAIPFYRAGRVLRFDVEEVRAALRASAPKSRRRHVEPDLEAV